MPADGYSPLVFEECQRANLRSISRDGCSTVKGHEACSGSAPAQRQIAHSLSVMSLDYITKLYRHRYIHQCNLRLLFIHQCNLPRNLFKRLTVNSLDFVLQFNSVLSSAQGRKLGTFFFPGRYTRDASPPAYGAACKKATASDGTSEKQIGAHIRLKQRSP